MVTGVGAGGTTGAADASGEGCAGAAGAPEPPTRPEPRMPGRPGAPPGPPVRRRCRPRQPGPTTPTTMSVTSSTLEIRPIVETGMLRALGRDLARRERQVVGREDAGHLAERHAVGGELVGIQGDEDPLLLAAGDVHAADALDARGGPAGSRPGRSAAASARPSSVVAAMDAMMTGEALMLSAVTWGVDRLAGGPRSAGSARWPPGSPSRRSRTRTARRRGASELADVDCRPSRRGTPEMARSIGLVTCSATSAAPAPGQRSDDRDDRELDVREQLLLEAAPGEDARR